MPDFKRAIAIFFWRMNRADFFRDLGNAFTRDAPIRDHLERELLNAKMIKNSEAATVIHYMLVRLAAGQGDLLQDLFRGICTKEDQILLATVDDSKDKPAALEALADAIEFKQRSMVILRDNLIQPMVAFPLAVIVAVTTADIVQEIAKDAPPAMWVGFNGLVKDMSIGINNYWLLVLISIIGFFILVLWSLARWKGHTRAKLESWPIYSLYQNYMAAVVLSAMAMILKNKKTLPEALEILRKDSQPWMSWQLTKILYSLEDNSHDYSAAFSKGLLPLRVRGRLMSLSESSPAFEEALIELGSKETVRLEKTISITAAALNWGITGASVFVAVVLSIGLMTITSSLQALSTAPVQQVR